MSLRFREEDFNEDQGHHVSELNLLLICRPLQARCETAFQPLGRSGHLHHGACRGKGWGGVVMEWSGVEGATGFSYIREMWEKSLMSTCLEDND